jgi:hypothetical protein
MRPLVLVLSDGQEHPVQSIRDILARGRANDATLSCRPRTGARSGRQSSHSVRGEGECPAPRPPDFRVAARTRECSPWLSHLRSSSTLSSSSLLLDAQHRDLIAAGVDGEQVLAVTGGLQRTLRTRCRFPFRRYPLQTPEPCRGVSVPSACRSKPAIVFVPAVLSSTYRCPTTSDAAELLSAAAAAPTAASVSRLIVTAHA